MANIEFSTVLTPSATTRLYGHNGVDSGGFPTQSGNFAVTDIASAFGTLLEFRQDSGNSRLYTLYINGTPSASFETPPDKFLESVIFNEDTLCLELTFYEGDVTETVSVSMSKLVDVYLAGNGLSKSSTTFSVKAKTGGYIIVDEQGVDVDLSSVNSRIATVEGRVTDVETQLDGHMDEINTALQGAREAEENAEASSTRASQSASSAQSSANTATAKATEANNSAVSAGNIKTQVQQIADEIESNMIVSIEQTVTSTESSGVNEVTITQEDGTESTFEVRNGAKGDKGDKGDKAEYISICSDNEVFDVDYFGEKSLSNQKANIKITTQGLDGFSVDAGPIPIPDNTSEFTITPNMMGWDPIGLTQMLSDTFEDSSKWSYSSQSISVANGVITQVTYVGSNDYVNSKFSMSISERRRYYIGVNIDSVSEILGQMRIYLRTSSGAITNQNTVILTSDMVGKRFSAIVNPYSTTNASYFAFGIWQTSSSITAKFSEPILMDITDLIASSPKLQSMTDAELKTWCDTYIPFVNANSTWTVGGKATNLLPNPTSSDGWEARSAVTGFSASNGIVTGSMSKALNSYDDSWLRKSLGNNPFVIGDSVYIHLGDISGTNFAFGLSYWRFASNANSGIRSVERANDFDKYITVGANLNQSATVTIETTKGINVLNLTSSGWLAQLSLMGIEGTDSVKAWLDTYVPFFEGSVAFPKFDRLPITVTSGNFSDTISISCNRGTASKLAVGWEGNENLKGKTFETPEELDDFLDTGKVQWCKVNGTAMPPIYNDGMIESIGWRSPKDGTGYGRQIHYNDDGNQIYSRAMSNSAWGDWIKLDTNYDVNGKRTADLNMGGHTIKEIYKLVPKSGTTGNTSIGNIIPLPYYNSSAVGSSNSITDFLKKLIAQICRDYPNVVQGLFLGVCEPSGAGAIIINIYGTSDVDSTSGLPRFASCKYITSSTAPSIHVASVYNFTFYHREI